MALALLFLVVDEEFELFAEIVPALPEELVVFKLSLAFFSLPS
jgi:hypothetical protein